MTLYQIRSGEVPGLIKNTAKEIAGAFYDMNRTERFRKSVGSQDNFVRRHWKDHVPTAIECLGGVLGLPGTPQDHKDAIYDAITTFHDRASYGKPRELSVRNWL